MGMGLEPGNIRLCKIIMYSQRYYTLFFPGCQGPEENIYSSSGKFHTVSWREPVPAQHLGNGLAAPGNAAWGHR